MEDAGAEVVAWADQALRTAYFRSLFGTLRMLSQATILALVATENELVAVPRLGLDLFGQRITRLVFVWRLSLSQSSRLPQISDAEVHGGLQPGGDSSVLIDFHLDWKGPSSTGLRVAQLSLHRLFRDAMANNRPSTATEAVLSNLDALVPPLNGVIKGTSTGCVVQLSSQSDVTWAMSPRFDLTFAKWAATIHMEQSSSSVHVDVTGCATCGSFQADLTYSILLSGPGTHTVSYRSCRRCVQW